MGRIREFLAKVLASTFGSGYFPLAPGTVGAGVAFVMLWFIEWSFLFLFLCSILLFFIGVWAATTAEKSWGVDPGRVNLDEFVGMMISVVFLTKSLSSYTAAFIFFRIFDIVKPFPIAKAEQWPCGWGIMADDAIAGLYANVLTQLLFRVIWPHG